MTLLVGEDDTTDYTGDTATYGSDDEIVWELPFTAVESGSADTVYFWYFGNSTASNIRMVLRDASLNIVATATKTIASMTPEAWNTFDISGAAEAIVQGNEYRIGVVADGYFRPYLDGTTYDVYHDSSSTYASPADPFVSDGTQNKGKFAAYVDGTTGSGPTDVATRVEVEYNRN